MTVKFLIDRELLQSQKELNEILETIKQDPKQEVNAEVVSTFVRAIILSQLEQQQLKLKEQRIAEAQKLRPTKIIKEFKEIEKTLPSAPKPLPPPPRPKKEKYHSLRKQYPLVLSKEHKQLATALLTLDTITKKPKYFLTEPEVHPELLKKIEKAKRNIQHEPAMIALTKKLTKKYKLEYKDELIPTVKYYLKRDKEGFGKIDALIHDNNIEKISCNGVNKPITISYKNLPMEIETNISYASNEELNNFVNLLAEKAQVKLNKKIPILDATIDSLKVHATLGNDMVNSTFTITK